MKYSDLESLINYCKYRQCDYCEFYTKEKESPCYFSETPPSRWDMKKLRLSLRVKRSEIMETHP